MQVKNLSLNSETKQAESKDKDKDDGADGPMSPAEKSLLQKIIHKGLVESTKDLEIQRKDPSSPLFSVKSFELLHLYVLIIYL